MEPEPPLSSKCLCPHLLRKAIAEAKLQEKWDATSAAKKFAQRAKRANLGDFDRFKVMIKRKNRSFKVRQLAKKIGGAPAAKGKQPAGKGKAKK